MLKYRLNTNNFLYKGNNVPIDAFRSVDMLGIENRMKKILICSTKDIDNINVGTKIFSLTKLNISDWSWYSTDPSSPDNKDYWSVTPYTYDFVRDYEVAAVDRDKHIFTVVVDKYFELSPTSITFNTEYVDFFFEKSHYFDKPIEGETVTIFLKYVTDDGIETMLPLESEYSNVHLLRFNYKNTTDEIQKALKKIYASGGDLPYNLNNRFAEVYREDFFYTDTMSLNFYYDKPLTTLNVPLQQNFETNMYQSEALKTKYIEVEKKNAVNKIVDMERDVYHPVIYVGNEVRPVYDIKLNLHFREHRGDDWIASPLSYWNGTYIDNNNEVQLMNDSNNSSLAYFSYIKNNNSIACKDNASCQSDLISYLNFTNNDVKYQKNRLKKSFLRLSFYDSDSLTEQNLLYYSTIYLDSGKLFSKYVRRIEDKPYSMIIYNDNGSYNSVKQGLGGIKVDREPYDSLLNEDDVEELRLSSQITVSDKYNSLASSEGFYLYLWRDNFNGKIPTDIYMKVEFNHAGYGRSIPFMMPYWDSKKHNGRSGIKTFQEILNDWNDEGLENGTDGPYGIRQYLKYSLIHFKYQYDDNLKQHVYYLDNEFYGSDSCNFDNNTIILNLYEAKVSDGYSSPRKSPSINDNTITSYGLITVDLSYPDKIDVNGGISEPIASATQKVYYQNGTSGDITLTSDNSIYRYFGNNTNTTNGVVTYNNANNSYNELKVATVTLSVSANGKTGTAVANVYQEAQTGQNYEFYLQSTHGGNIISNTNGTYDCGYIGGVVSFDVVSTLNGAFCNYDWSEKGGLGDDATINGNTVKILVGSLDNISQTRQLILKLKQEGSEQEITINIEQAGSSYVFDIDPYTVEFNSDGGEAIVNVTSTFDSTENNISYDIADVSSVNWIDYVKKDTANNYIVNVKVDENIGAEDLTHDVVFTQDESNNTQTLHIVVRAANVQPTWEVVREYCEVDEDNNNTGILKTEYIDNNPLSATYGNTKTESTEDYDRCPLPVADTYEFEFTDMVVEPNEEPDTPEPDVETEIIKSMSSLLPSSNFGVNMGHQLERLPGYDFFVLYLDSFLRQQFKISVLDTDIILSNLEFNCTFYSVPYNYNEMTGNKPTWYKKVDYQLHFPSGAPVGSASNVLQTITFYTDNNGYVNRIKTDNGIDQSYPSSVGDMYMFMPSVDTVDNYDSDPYVCMGVESNQFTVTISGKSYSVKVFGFYGNNTAYGNNGIVLRFNQN